MKRKNADQFLGLLSLVAIIGCANRDETGENGLVDETGIVEERIQMKEFGALDENADRYLANEEFCSGLKDGGLFAAWDNNGDDIVESGEYVEGVFNLHDTNRNGVLDSAEWVTVWFSNDRSLEEWDIDDNGDVTAGELFAGVENHGILVSWDTDGNGLSREEFCSQAYSSADTDGNQRVEREEWQNFVKPRA